MRSNNEVVGPNIEELSLEELIEYYRGMGIRDWYKLKSIQQNHLMYLLLIEDVRESDRRGFSNSDTVESFRDNFQHYAEIIDSLLRGRSKTPQVDVATRIGQRSGMNPVIRGHLQTIDAFFDGKL